MRQIEFDFEPAPWEQLLATLTPGQSLSAVQFLAVMENEEEQALEEALAELEENRILLDISELPAVSYDDKAAVRLRRELQLVSSGRLLQDLEDTDPLRLYLEEVAATPAAGDPQLLAERCAAGDEGAMQQLTNVMLSRVIGCAQELVGKGVLLLDLIQEGSLGLWQAILQYRDGCFEDQCDWWIRAYLARAVVLQARSGGIGRKLRQGMEDYRDVDQRLLSELGRNPTLEEIAEEMHVSVEEAAIFASMLKAARSKQPEPEEQEEDLAEADQAVENTAYFQARQRILELLSTLSEEDAQLLTLRFGLEGGMPLDPRETGRRLGLTPEEVVAREAQALQQLRQEN